MDAKVLKEKKLREKECRIRKPSSPRLRLDPLVFSKIKQLKKMLSQQDRKCWEIGDLCIELIGDHKLSLGQIAQYTGYSKTRISHFHLTCRTFSAKQRDGYTFQDSLTARQIHIYLPRLNKSPAEIREEVVGLRNKTVGKVREHFVQLLIRQEMAQDIEYQTSGVSGSTEWLNTCHHADWRQIVPQVPDQSVQLFLCDPPYAIETGYRSKRDMTNALRNDCDYGSTDRQALEVTLPLFELCLPKLKPEGLLLLFQGGGKADKVEVLQKAHECGWESISALTWDKGHLSVKNFMNPYLICSERILVFCRRGAHPKKFQDGTPHSDVLRFPTDTQRATKRMHLGKMEYGDYHMFQKPLNLMEFLIRHHTYPGDLVVEPFGCSGAGSIAALQANRQWVYIESNRKNFLWGSQRINKAVLEQSSQTG